MTATRRGLELLVALGVILGVLLVLDLRRETATTDHSLAQGLDIDAVSALAWVRPGAPELQLVREREQWKWVTPVEALADRGAVTNVLATLRAARWHRREPASAAGPTHAVLTISTASPTTGGKPPEYADLPRRTLAIGAPLPGTEQAWIVDGDDALLVDAWVARALDPEPVTLMTRRPLDAVAQVAWIEMTNALGTLRVEGSPRRLVAPYVALLRPELTARLHEALAALEIVALPPGRGQKAVDSPAWPEGNLRISTPAGTLTISDGCGGGETVLLASPSVTGCIARTAYRALLATPLQATGRDVIDPRPAPLDAATITLRDGAILDVTRSRIGEHVADPVRVTELLSVLSAPAELADAPRGAKPRATLTVADRHGATITLELLAGRVVRRPGEDLGMKLTPAAASMLEGTAAAFRDLTPWVEDPLAVSAIRIDDRHSAVRGAVVGEWSHPDKTSQMPWAPADVSRAFETLATQLAAPRSLAVGPATFPTLHRVVIVVAPPAGKVVEHALEIGRKTAAGCPVRAAGTPLLLPAAVCDAVSVIAR